MGRKYTNKAHKHFTYNKTEDTSHCTICKTSLKGNHGTNLKKHLMRNHEFKEDYFTEVTLINKSNKCKEVTNILQNQRKIQQQINEMNAIKLNITRKDLENNCIELVTVNGRPFSILDDSGFQNIVNPIKCAIEEKNKQKFSISSESIQKK
ncbi:PREDICTED: uncharacterized protein LOC105455070, partial [Wasmannia auropunctata]|uniref:uncharacterized protein LOC105455070 n=1 Tax=Wasmannia auropunctata TaxID=64793 RepID=UPI0005EFB939